MSRTAAGRDYSSDAHFATARPAPATVIALSETSTLAPVADGNPWTTLGGAPGNELAADGFGRAIAVYVHTAGTTTATLQRTFTHSGAVGASERNIRQVGVFAPAVAGSAGGPDSGTLVFVMDEPNPPRLTGTDALNQTVTVDLGA